MANRKEYYRGQFSLKYGTDGSTIYNTPCGNKKDKIIKEKKVVLPDNPLGTDDNAPGLLKILMKESNVAISDKRYKQCISRYGNVLNFLGELGGRCHMMLGVRYAEPKECIADDCNNSLDSLVYVGMKKSNKKIKGFWIIEEID